MENIIKNYGVQHGIKLSTKNTGVAAHIDSLPLYMAIFL
jgi:hypothetical protein